METTFVDRCAIAAEHHRDREQDRHVADDWRPEMRHRLAAAVAAGAEMETQHMSSTVGIVSLVAEVLNEATGTPELDRELTALGITALRPLPDDAQIGALFRELLCAAIEQYAQALDSAEERGISITFSNEGVSA